MSQESNALRQLIPRDWKYSSPVQPYHANINCASYTFPAEFFKQHYCRFMNDILPAYEVDPNIIPSVPVETLKELCNDESSDSLLLEVIMRHFLLAGQKLGITAHGHQAFTKASLLYNDLYIASQLIKKRQMNQDIANFCDMLLAELADLYAAKFAEIVDGKFWSQTKTPKQLLHSVFTKEAEKLRLLEQYSYETLGKILVRRAKETAPSSALPTIINWAQENDLNIE